MQMDNPLHLAGTVLVVRAGARLTGCASAATRDVGEAECFS